MAMTVTRVDVWVVRLKDKPGALGAKLASLAEAGANLAFVVARRDKPGTGVAFVTPIKGPKQIAAAKKAKFRKTKSLHGLKVEAGINLRGLSAAAIGRRCVAYIAVDKAADLTQAGRILRKL